jgi:hypothetical protein
MCLSSIAALAHRQDKWLMRCVKAGCIIPSGLTDTRHLTFVFSPCSTGLFNMALLMFFVKVRIKMLRYLPWHVCASACLSVCDVLPTDVKTTAHRRFCSTSKLMVIFFCKRLTSCLLTFHINTTENCEMRLWVVSCPSRCARITTRDWLNKVWYLDHTKHYLAIETLLQQGNNSPVNNLLQDMKAFLRRAREKITCLSELKIFRIKFVKRYNPFLERHNTFIQGHNSFIGRHNSFLEL